MIIAARIWEFINKVINLHIADCVGVLKVAKLHVFHSAILWHSKISLGDILVIYFALYIFPTFGIGQQPLNEVDYECRVSDCDA